MATATMIVLQLGLATIPDGTSASASAFTSGTTNGTSGRIRNALELSTTRAPAATKRSAASRLRCAPAEKNARSTGGTRSGSRASTSISAPR